MWFSFGWLVNEGFANSYNRSSAYRQGDRSRDSFEARQRLRTQINFIINEYLQGVALFEITMDWGKNTATNAGGGTGGRLNADGANVVTKHLYLDWMIPNTPVQVRMGIQPIALPSGPVGQPVLSADVAGISINSPITNWLGITFVWARPYDDQWFDGSTTANNGRRYDETDAFALILPMSFRNIGLDIKPWFMWANVGASSGYYDYVYGSNTSPYTTGSVGGSGITSDDRAAAWWLGLNLKFDLLDPLVFNFDAIYGSAGKSNLRGFGSSAGTWNAAGTAITPGSYNPGIGDDAYVGTRGWFISASLDYKLNLGNNISLIPGIFGWWASGDGENAAENGQLGRLPHVGSDSGSMRATSFGMNGYFANTNQWGDGGVAIGTGTGTWGIGIQLARVTFLKDLEHTLRFAYYRGTNSSSLVKDYGFVLPYTDDGLYLTNKDSIFEINFDHQYKIYENLTACLELGWMHLSTDRDVWGAYNGSVNPGTVAANRGGRAHNNEKDGDNAWKAQLSFRFDF
jgi:hypothetical protein